MVRSWYLLAISIGLFTINPHLFPHLAPAQTGASTFEALLAQGVNQLGQGRFDAAEHFFNLAKQIAPQDARLYFYCGMALSQSGKMEDAASELVEAVHLAPERLEYRVFEAHVFEQLKQATAAAHALAPFKDVAALQRLSPAWLRLLTDDFFQLAESDMALRALELWEKSAPGDTGISFVRGQICLQKMDLDGALKAFQQSVKEPGYNPEGYYEIGKILYGRNQFAAARDALLTAVREDGSNPDYAAKLASVYLALKDPDAAIQCLQRVEPAAPNAPTVYYLLARAYEQKGDSARSKDYFGKFQAATAAERERSEHRLQMDAPIGQAFRALDEGHTAEARTLFEKALQMDPNRWEPHANLAEIDLNGGDFKSAYPHLQKLQQINPDSAVGNFLMTRYWFHEKNYEQARIYAERVKAIRPDNSELRIMLGDIYSQLGEKQKAVQEYEAALRLAPGRQDLRDRVARAEGSKQ